MEREGKFTSGKKYTNLIYLLLISIHPALDQTQESVPNSIIEDENLISEID